VRRTTFACARPSNWRPADGTCQNVRPGSPIFISGEHHGPFRNRGIVLDAVPCALLRYTHLSSVSGLADVPEHYSVIAFTLDAVDDGTAVRVTVERRIM